MALIKCLECGKEISDKAVSCPNCGFPIQEHLSDNNEYLACEICGKQFKKDSSYNVCSNCLSEIDAEIEKEQGGSFFSQKEVDDEPVRCPRCGSSQVSAAHRGYSLLTGFIGSGKIYITCLKCGYKWKAGAHY